MPGVVFFFFLILPSVEIFFHDGLDFITADYMLYAHRIDSRRGSAFICVALFHGVVCGELVHGPHH